MKRTILLLLLVVAYVLIPTKGYAQGVCYVCTTESSGSACWAFPRYTSIGACAQRGNSSCDVGNISCETHYPEFGGEGPMYCELSGGHCVLAWDDADVTPVIEERTRPEFRAGKIAQFFIDSGLMTASDFADFAYKVDQRVGRGVSLGESIAREAEYRLEFTRLTGDILKIEGIPVANPMTRQALAERFRRQREAIEIRDRLRL